jgi:hypothetical protein
LREIQGGYYAYTYKPGYDAIPGGALFYGDIEESADIVVVTHEHPDQNNIAAVPDNPEIIGGAETRGVTAIKSRGIEFKGIHCFLKADLCWYTFPRELPACYL